MSMSASEIAMNQKAYDDWFNGLNKDLDEGAIRARRKRIVINVINGEPKDVQKTYFMEYFINNLTMKEIGEKYGVHRATVSRTLQRAYKNLHRALKYIAPDLGILCAEDMVMFKRSFFRKQR